jgi:hypothetical protein
MGAILLSIFLQTILPLIVKALVERLLKRLPAAVHAERRPVFRDRLLKAWRRGGDREAIREAHAISCEIDEECSPL